MSDNESEKIGTDMNLRTVTTWTTGVMMILALLIPAGILLYTGFAEAIAYPPVPGVVGYIIILTFFVAHVMALSPIIWLFSGTPLLVAYILAKKLKYKPSTVILLVSSIAYGIWFTSVSAYLSDYGIGRLSTCVQLLTLIGPCSLPVMLPCWIVALRLNSSYTKKSLSDSENPTE